MSAFGWLVLLAAALGAGGYFAIVGPALRLLAALRRTAEGDRDAARLIEHPGPFRAACGDLARLGDQLEEMDRQLRGETSDLHAILGSLSEGVLIIDDTQRIRLANDSLKRMFDLRSPPLQRTLMEVFRDHTLQETVLAALEDGRPQSRQLVLDSRRENRYVQKHFAITAVGLRPHGTERPVGAIAIFHDITELKGLETARRDFVANVSHELRTPLSIINGYLETLLDGALADRQVAEKFLRVMWKHTERLHLLVEDLLSLSQLENRQAAALHFEEVQLRACLERVVERLEANIAERAAAVRLDFPEGMPGVEADPVRLDQAFFNLLDNALKYGDPGRLKVSVTAAYTDNEVLVAVIDNGPGIPSADQPHIFERFYRVHKDRSRTVGGTGLGLSIVKNIVQAHGGDVAVDSTPGAGATFRLRLPLLQGR